MQSCWVLIMVDIHSLKFERVKICSKKRKKKQKLFRFFVFIPTFAGNWFWFSYYCCYFCFGSILRNEEISLIMQFLKAKFSVFLLLLKVGQKCSQLHREIWIKFRLKKKCWERSREPLKKLVGRFVIIFGMWVQRNQCELFLEARKHIFFLRFLTGSTHFRFYFQCWAH